MDLLKAEMERKKRAMAAAKQASSGTNNGSGGGTTSSKLKKFLKASELRKRQEEAEEEEWRKKKRRKTGSSSNTSTKEGAENGEGSSSRSHQSENRQQAREKTTTESTEADDDHTTTTAVPSATSSLSPTQVTTRLRSLGLPIRLFGEQEDDRLDRLRTALQLRENNKLKLGEMDEFRLGKEHTTRNVFLEKDSDAVIDDDHGVGAAAASKKKKSNQATSDEKQKKSEAETEGRDEDLSKDPHKKVYRYFKDLLKQWEDDLVRREDAAKRTTAGKNETKTHKQCRDYIRPLFKLCKSRELEPSLLGHLVKIVDFCQSGEFVKANDAYMDVAIGRAAWPIGVTMVGIHARSGRAKIESSNVAHVMNSELQRKYLTSVKRLMTYAQSKAENVAPSKKVR